MVLKTMKHVTAMTYRWALGWWRHPCSVLCQVIFIKGCVPGRKCGLTGIGLYTDQKGVSGYY